MDAYEIRPLVNQITADNMLSFALQHATQARLCAALDDMVRVAHPDTDQPTLIRVRQLTNQHVRLS